ncbi:phytochelatin synthase family protein [Piscinibacter defluvii]|uniref:phytochelatin synthase family protein n=1 Tax=Piscinibacter defluvii TaxID=1796922 RepID=UPI000FDDCC52|nr:phytochelatin synthase family protein [Piscinibacter defluvii]
MRRFAKRAAIAVSLTPLIAASAVLWYALSEPPAENLPLAPELTSAVSAEGQELLSSATSKVDCAQLAQYVQAQARRAFCGPATVSAVLNAALAPQPPATQRSLFNASTAPIKGELALSLSGLTLPELAGFLLAHGMQVQLVHASQSDLASFRHAARAALAEPRTFIIVNYDRRTLKQAGAGHISPLGAFDASTDRVLVMDVAKQKYPYTWVPVSMLWDAMNTLDADSGRMRGYLLATAADSKR